MTNNIASNWRALSGKNNWEGLLNNPFNDNLRIYLIHYGKMVGAIVDALNNLKVSEAYGLSRYPEDELFDRVGLKKGNPFEYRVTKYFYLKSEFGFPGVILHEGSAWFGYVAESTDVGKLNLGRRDILVCWRGTNTSPEWLKDAEICQISVADMLGKANKPTVHKGFYECYTAKDNKSTYNKISAREQVLDEIKRLVCKYKNEKVSITIAGHSLGAALATLNAMDIVANGFNKPNESAPGLPVTAFAYASPHVGNKGFKKAFSDLSNFSNLRLLRIKNFFDPVPRILICGYKHVGIELNINSSKSKDLRIGSICHAHDLNIHLHGIAGYQGRKRKFQLGGNLNPPHDIALVNKHTSALHNRHRIPPKWWDSRNNTIFQKEDGSWELNYYVPKPSSGNDTEENNTPPRKKAKISPIPNEF